MTLSNLANVVVAVRLRPLNAHEIATGIKSCCQDIGNNVLAIRKAGDAMQYLKSQQLAINEYAFDVVFDEHATQRQVYEKTAQPFINNLLDGQNVTVFAYGATGAGKTHTMLGNTRADEASERAEAGIIPNAVQDLFLSMYRRQQSKSAAKQASESFQVVLSFLEVYNEQVFDLLDSSGKVLFVRDDQDKNVVVSGITEQLVADYDQVIDLVVQGNKRRKTEATMANDVSSRSHAVLQLLVRQTTRSETTGREMCVESKLSLIDLAGSERASATNNRGARLQEGANINKSLLALANCINTLAENSQQGGKRITNVKYRDSKLTHLLKSSLEGNCNLVMIANINPSDATYEDSHNTLKYANRAKNIKVNPVAKEICKDKDSTWVERETRLREENATLKRMVRELETQVKELQRFKTAVLQNDGMLPEDYLDLPLDSHRSTTRTSETSGSMESLTEDEFDSTLQSNLADHGEDDLFLPKKTNRDPLLPPTATPAPTFCVAPAAVAGAARKRRVSLLPTPMATSSSSSSAIVATKNAPASGNGVALNTRRKSCAAVPAPRENNFMANAAPAKNPFEAVLADKAEPRQCRPVARRRSTRLSLSATMVTATAINLASSSTPQVTSASSSAGESGAALKVVKKARITGANNNNSNSPVHVYESPSKTEFETVAEEEEEEPAIRLEDFEPSLDWLTKSSEVSVAAKSPSKKRKSCTITRRRSMAKVAAMLDSLAQDVTVNFDFSSKFAAETESSTTTGAAPRANTDFVGIVRQHEDSENPCRVTRSMSTPNNKLSSRRKSVQPPFAKGKEKTATNNENVFNFQPVSQSVGIDI